MVSFLDLIADSGNKNNDVFDYCIHCRCALRSRSNKCGVVVVGGGDGDRNRNGNGNESAYEGDDDYPLALRCSRCCVVHYCSRDCQKANFPLHKKRCKAIQKLRSPGSIPTNINNNNDDNNNNNNNNNDGDDDSTRRMALAHHILELAYCSTDTIARGMRTYDLALAECYKLFRKDFRAVGALPTLLLLSAILGHDRICLALIDSCLHRWDCCGESMGANAANADANAANANANANAESDEDHLLEWIFGDKYTGNNTTGIMVEEERIIEFQFEKHHPSYGHQRLQTKIPWQKLWCANNFLVPLLLIQLRNQARLEPTSACASSSDNPHQQQQLHESARICRSIEYSTSDTLPVVRSLLLDSGLRWGPSAASALLCAQTQTQTQTPHSSSLSDHENTWEATCYVLWMILKDWVAFTPGVSDALEDTIGSMETHRIPLVSERGCRDPAAPSSSSSSSEGWTAPAVASFLNPAVASAIADIDPSTRGWVAAYLEQLNVNDDTRSDGDD